jgi:hypothetical protein
MAKLAAAIDAVEAPHPMPRIQLERLFPRAIAENWGIKKLAEAAGVGDAIAGRFLRAKAREIEKRNRESIIGFSADAGAILQGATARQFRRLAKLAELDEDKWKREDFQLEKHCMYLLKPLLEWTKPGSSMPGNNDSEPRQLSDGL